MDQTYKPLSWKRKTLDPNSHSRVCSFHFVDGAPNSVNPFPTLNLGCDATTRIRTFSEQSTRNENRVTAESPIMEGIATPLKKSPNTTWWKVSYNNQEERERSSKRRKSLIQS